MTEDRRNIFLWEPFQVGKYSPVFNENFIDISPEERIILGKKYRSHTLDLDTCHFILRWKLKSDFEEKKLRTYDCFYDNTGMFMYQGFFIHDWLLNCWSDLIDKDIKVISTECRTLNGIVKDFHLVYVMHGVYGLDPELSERTKGKKHKLVPKASNEFMEGHQIACEKRRNVYIYITPELKERTLKAKGKSKLKDVWIPTFKEEWDKLWSREYGPY